MNPWYALTHEEVTQWVKLAHDVLRCCPAELAVSARLATGGARPIIRIKRRDRWYESWTWTGFDAKGNGLPFDMWMSNGPRPVYSGDPP